MASKEISNGTVHKTPSDMRKVFSSEAKLHTLWQGLTPLARNEWICWVESVKKQETREKHLLVMKDKLLKGDRRPCCWAGCPHR